MHFRGNTIFKIFLSWSEHALRQIYTLETQTTDPGSGDTYRSWWYCTGLYVISQRPNGFNLQLGQLDTVAFYTWQ